MKCNYIDLLPYCEYKRPEMFLTIDSDLWCLNVNFQQYKYLELMYKLSGTYHRPTHANE